MVNYLKKELYKRFLVVIFITTIAIIFGFFLEWQFGFLVGFPFGHTQFGHLAGWVGLVVILGVFIYPIRKRYNRKSGWPKFAFWLHQVAGIAGVFIIFVHSGSHFHALVPVLTLITMGIVVFSGIVGIVVHRKAIGMLRETRQILAGQGFSSEQIEERLFELASSEQRFKGWQNIHTPVAVLFFILLLAHVGGAIYWGGF